MSDLADRLPPAGLGAVPNSAPPQSSGGLVPVAVSLAPGPTPSPSLSLSQEESREPSPSGTVAPPSLPPVDPLILLVGDLGLGPDLVASRLDAFDHGVELEWTPARCPSGCPVTGVGRSLPARPSSAEVGAPSLLGSYCQPPLYPVRAPLISSPVRQLSSSEPPQAEFEFNEFSFPPLSKSEGTSNSLIFSSPVSSVPLPGAADVKPPGAGRASWASLVKDPPVDMKLSYIKPSIQTVDGRLRCILPPAVAISGAAAWENSLVGFFLDKLPFSLVNSQAHRLWDAKGLSEVLCNDNGFYFFKFRDKSSSLDALHGGPWHFGGRPIFLQAWRQGMNLSKDGCKRVPIWAHFRNVPLELWTTEGLSHIASTVGIPLHADRLTASLKRLSFARICVEIGFDDSLPNSLDLVLADGSIAEILIEYNWVPKKCSICMAFGHLPKNCKKRPHQVWVPKVSPRPSSAFEDDDRPGKVSVDPGTGPEVPVDPAPLPGLGRVYHLSSRSGIGPSSPSAAPFSSGSGSGSGSISNAFAPLLDLDDALIKKGEGSLAQPSAFSADCPSPTLMAVPDDCLCRDDSPIGSTGLSSRSSSSSTPPLAKRLILVDELERKQGKPSKNKKKGRSAGISKGKNLSDFG